MTSNSDFKGPLLFDVEYISNDKYRYDYHRPPIESDVAYCNVPSLMTLNDLQGNDLEGRSRSLAMAHFLSENKCNLLFRSLIERPDLTNDLTKDDIADNLQ